MKDDWSIPRHLRELVKQVLTPEGVMLVASMYTCVRVLTQGPEWAAWPVIIWNAMMIFNRTGRWIIPDFLQKWFAAKNGTVPSTLTMTAKEGSVSASVTPTEAKP